MSWAAMPTDCTRFVVECPPVLLGGGLHRTFMFSMSLHLSLPLYGSLSSVVNVAPAYYQQILAHIYSGLVLGWCLTNFFPYRPCVFTLWLCCVPLGVSDSTWIHLLAFYTSSLLKLGHHKNHGFIAFFKKIFLEKIIIYMWRLNDRMIS